MAGASITTLNNVLKEFYLPPVVEQLNNEVLLLSRLEARDQELVGKAAYIPLHTGRSGGIGARGEYVQLPEPGNQVYARAEFTLKYLYGVIRVSGPSVELTASDMGSFVQALKSELDGIRSDLRKDVARQIYGDGTGAIATCGVTSAANVVVLASREAIDKGQLYVGMVVDIGTAAAPTLRATSRTITAVTPGTPSITIDGAAVTTAGTDFVGRAGARYAAGTYEINGLAALASTAASSFGGINAASAGNEYWDNLRDTAGTAISETRLMQGFNQVRLAGGEVSAVLTGFANQRVFWATLTSLRRFNDPMKIEGGFQTLDFMGKPVIADVDHPVGKVHLLDERFIKVFSNRDWHFLDQDNSTLKWDTNFDAWKAVLTRYLQLGASRRNTQMVLTTDATTGY